MSSSRLWVPTQVERTPVRVEDVPSVRPPFCAAYGAAETRRDPQLPRSWTQVELLVEERLLAFESRHQLECEEAFKRGRVEGRRQQETEVRERLEAAAGPWRILQAAVEGELSAYREELYRASTELSAALARAWLGRVVEQNPHVFEAGLRQALEALGDQEEIEVHLHPDDFNTYREGLYEPDTVLSDARGFTLKADAQVDRGGAIATSRGGTADARLSVRVQKALDWFSSPDEPR